ncbi:CDP-glycerol glycerophosphotransferase family protein [Clostridioides sp. GD02377]|uniref:bifunctional glycosyltransferase/CDP-glycerol:glycerophosphate glycerophosphotransferase n=1 Tax=unclassified Clostridioides TaxID=2635829 RepID=UPI0038A598BC
MSNYEYKFSIVIPIYNVEEYLDCTIDSIINQENINFKADIQIILINDGSPDNSEEICLKYKALYPNNIVYIHKENGGVSSARNEGLKFIKGKYVNFIDSDDKFDKNVLDKVYKFFECHYDEIDFVSIPLYFFELVEGEHGLNYKFEVSKVIDIFEEYKSIQLHSGSSFFKNEITKRFEFDKNLKYAEDTKFLTNILLEKCKFGVISDAKYFYRRRKNMSSAIQNGKNRKEWYNEYIINFSSYVLKYAKYKLGVIPKYIQYLVMYDLQWRVSVSNLSDDIFNDEEKIEFKKNLKTVLLDVEDSIIIEQKNIYIEHKLFCIKLKYGSQINISKIINANEIYYGINEKFIYKLSNFKPRIDFLHVQDNQFVIEGFLNYLDAFKDEDISVIAKCNSVIYTSEVLENVVYDKFSLDEVILQRKYFSIKIPLSNNMENRVIELFVKSNGIEIKTKPIFNKFVRLYADIEKSYFIENGYCVVYHDSLFSVIKANNKSKIGREFRFIQELLKNKKYKITLIRIISYLLKILKRNELWLFMDRVNEADDNAEALFKYALNRKDSIKKYFVISKNSKDYKRISKIGKVIKFGSCKHKLFLILSDKMISSHIEDNIRCGLQSGGKYLKNLIDFKFIFLQHGITKDDLSSWLNKYNKNIDLFITASIQEYNSILEGKYYYDNNVVKLTGFARYDNLKDCNKKQIVICPTWRRSLVSDINVENGERNYNENFKKSYYFEVYNKLINDIELIECARRCGYKIIFFPHPNVHQQIKDFKKNDYVVFKNAESSYNRLFCESSLFITDYSSVAFDFAFLKKPVIYYQYDREEIFKNGTHTYSKGYFDYNTMGFGEVCTEYKELVNLIVEYIENDCKIKDKYIERINKFYKYNDIENCKRIYDNITNMI